MSGYYNTVCGDAAAYFGSQINHINSHRHNSRNLWWHNHSKVQQVTIFCGKWRANTVVASFASSKPSLILDSCYCVVTCKLVLNLGTTCCLLKWTCEILVWAENVKGWAYGVTSVAYASCIRSFTTIASSSVTCQTAENTPYFNAVLNALSRVTNIDVTNCHVECLQVSLWH